MILRLETHILEEKREAGGCNSQPLVPTSGALKLCGSWTVQEGLCRTEFRWNM